MKQKTKEIKEEQEQEDIKRKVIRVTNPDYLLQNMSKMIYDFAGKLNLPGMSYESLMSYYMYTAGIETYVALIDGEPKGFISIGIMGPPYYSTAIVNSIYSSAQDPILSNQMYDVLIEFMQKHKLLYYYYVAVSKKLGEHFAKKAKERDFTVSCLGYYYSGKRTFKR